MLKKFFISYIMLCAASAAGFAYSFNFSADYQSVGGIGNDIDFNPATHEDKTYFSQRLIPAFDLALNDNVSFHGKYQVSKVWGEEGPIGSTFASDNNNFRILDSYVEFSRSDNEYMKAGWQDASLPSFTFGNPFFNGHIPALNFRGVFCDYSAFNLIAAYPVRTQDNMPKANSGAMTAIVMDINKDAFTVQPYMAYVKMEHDVNSPYNWAAADNNSISYISVGGLAARYNIDARTTVSADGIYADQNNKGDHYYEAKGYHLALLMERHEDFGIPGFFVWRSSGNKGNKFYNHWDYGFLPSVATERSFAPSRLAFKGNEFLGRDSLVSPTGMGTAGIGLHLKDIKSFGKASHTVRGLYIRGTSSAPQIGRPAGEDVASVARPTKMEAGVMGDKDHAFEVDFDTAYPINDEVSAFVQAGYIKSDFKDSKYDRDIFNLEFILRVFFDDFIKG